MKHLKSYLIISTLLSTILTSCGDGHFYNNCCDIAVDGWDKDSPASFTYAIDDTASLYDVTVTIRHNSGYKYQNLWLFINKSIPSGVQVPDDTIECYLANEKGEFLGNGKSVIEMPVLIDSKHKFTEQGEYQINIMQGMRDDILAGIENICLTIDKSNGQE